MKFLPKPVRTVTSLFRSAPKEVGLPPGTLIHMGEQKIQTPVLSLIAYSADQFTEKKELSLEQCAEFKQLPGVRWYNLDGIHQVDLVESFGSLFALHPLVLEDILNTDHRPKVEEHDNCLVLIFKMLHFDEASSRVDAEQISLVLTAGEIISFQERPGDAFARVRDRLKRGSGRIRQRGPDYLAYALLDAVVDSYFHILEKLADQLEELESQLISQPDQKKLQDVHHLKGQLIYLRKNIWPLRELMNSLVQDNFNLISETTTLYLRDVYDHCIQVMETLESFRETAVGLIDLYMSSISYRMNEVMQVLTVMASIFIPLTFIAGIYGMNFQHMPELTWKYGYALVWGVMGLCAGVMIGFFKRKKWF